MTTVPASRVKLQNNELKDTYRVWLKDLYDDKPERLLHKLDKKKRHRGGHRARRNLRIQHAQQHTASSALKDVAVTKAEHSKLPSLSALVAPLDKQVVKNSQIRRRQALVDEANYAAVQYTSPLWRPGIAFFQRLVDQVLKKEFSDDSPQGLISTELADFPINIAPIILCVQEQNQEERFQGADSNKAIPSLVLHVCVYLHESSWREHREGLLHLLSNTSADACAVRKFSADIECRHNDLRLLSSHKEVEHAIDELWVNAIHTNDSNNDRENELLAVQKYIPFKGAATSMNSFSSHTNSAPSTDTNGRKAWITRCAFRKRDKHSSTVWIISGGGDCDSARQSVTLVTDSNSEDCQFVKCNMDQAWSGPRFLASMCTLAMEKALGVRFNEIVVDMLQDTSGNWWLLQVKAFTLAYSRPLSAATSSSLLTTSLLSKKAAISMSRTQSAPIRFEEGIFPISHWKKWRCAGRYCTIKNSDKRLSELTNPAQQESDDEHADNKEASGYFTKKMLRSCEFYDDFVRQQDMSLAGGFTEFPAALSFHLQHRLPKRDRSQLYEPQPLCNACLRRYHSLRQQWMVTIETRKEASTSHAAARNQKRIIHSKSFSENIEQGLPIPRKLPSLYREATTSSSLLKLSHSTSALRASSLGDKMVGLSNLGEKHIVPEKSTYLDELAAMERMLAQHEPPFTTRKAMNTVQSLEQEKHSESMTVVSFSSLPPEREKDRDIFPKWDGVTRIEAMWQNLDIKPLEKQLTGPDVDTSYDKQTYNSFSLQQELEILAATNDGNDVENDQTISQLSTIKEMEVEKVTSKSTCIAQLEPVKTHLIRVQHCRKVFEDDLYREQLVNDAVNKLCLGIEGVFFVAVPHDCTPTNTSSDKYRSQSKEQQEIAEMALRSLYLDVKLALAGASEDITDPLSLSSWPMRPTTCHEASGFLTVKLGSN